MRRRIGATGLAAAAAALALSACAGPMRQAAIAPAATAIPPRPAAPPGYAEAFVLPATDASGAYLTINHGVTPAQAMWHVRAALNVAVLGCRGPGEAALAAAYNAMLARQKRPLAAAYSAVQAQDKAAFGTGWQAAHDAAMTRLYNFFAQPAAKSAFCAIAADMLARTAVTAPDAFTQAAPAMLAELEAPFTATYARWDAYRTERAAWDMRYGGAGAPMLAYAPLDAVIAWAPARTNQRLASAR